MQIIPGLSQIPSHLVVLASSAISKSSITSNSLIAETPELARVLVLAISKGKCDKSSKTFTTLILKKRI